MYIYIYINTLQLWYTVIWNKTSDFSLDLHMTQERLVSSLPSGQRQLRVNNVVINRQMNNDDFSNRRL